LPRCSPQALAGGARAGLACPTAALQCMKAMKSWTWPAGRG